MVMEDFIKPTVIISRCLLGENCRYDASAKTSRAVKKMMPYMTIAGVCPEMDIGLGVPRETIRLVTGEKIKVISNIAQIDHTFEMKQFCTEFLNQHKLVSGAVLKSESPSCGYNDTKLFNENGVVESFKASGYFTQNLLSRHPDAFIEKEGQLKSKRTRELFYTKIFTMAAFFDLKQNDDIDGLSCFHDKNQFLFLRFSPSYYNMMSKILINKSNQEKLDAFEAYQLYLNKLLHVKPSIKKDKAVIIGLFSHVANQLTHREKRLFLDLVEKHQGKKVAFELLLDTIKPWAIRFDEKTAQQSIFCVFPKALMDIEDSSK
jgi:uncharacterized protein YbbK (DUF523 family)/uncharacterized protein YbgA (DUF1722 family)